jgi:hypothetical protein
MPLQLYDAQTKPVEMPFELLQKVIDTSKLTTFKDAAWYSTFRVGVIIV